MFAFPFALAVCPYAQSQCPVFFTFGSYRTSELQMAGSFDSSRDSSDSEFVADVRVALRDAIRVTERPDSEIRRKPIFKTFLLQYCSSVKYAVKHLFADQYANIRALVIFPPTSTPLSD